MIIIVVLILAGLIVWLYNNPYSDGVCIGTAMTSVILFFMILIASFSNGYGWQDRMELQSRYDAIQYKISSGIYQDKMDLRDIDLIDQIRRLNQDIVIGKIMQRNFWVGPFIPNIYDGFEPIDYKSVIK